MFAMVSMAMIVVMVITAIVVLFGVIDITFDLHWGNSAPALPVGLLFIAIALVIYKASRRGLRRLR